MGISESVEEYLEALWISEENQTGLTHIKWISTYLRISAPSAVEMLKKMEREDLVFYEERQGVRLTDKGKMAARRIIRGHRLVETLMKKTLKININEETACGMEHHMDEDFMDALCTLMNHPKKCPHGKPIPKGRYCPHKP